jgi:hypothetical protein
MRQRKNQDRVVVQRPVKETLFREEEEIDRIRCCEWVKEELIWDWKCRGQVSVEILSAGSI